MTRIIRVETCDRCPYVCGSRGCRHPDALVEVAGVLTIRMFDDYFVIPDWCPLEQAGPDWHPPAERAGSISARWWRREGRPSWPDFCSPPQRARPNRRRTCRGLM